MSLFFAGALSLLLLQSDTGRSGERPEFLHQGKRVVFLGDSITAAGDFISIIEGQLRLAYGLDIPELINLGLPSETCTGLSEPEHPFPRPDVHERLERALQRSTPDIVVACYGMNDGIYYPFDEERFAAYQAGIRKLVEKVKASGAKCILLTPPAFDPEPFRAKGKLLPKDAKEFAWFAIYEKYDEVIQRYANWVKEAGELGVERIDVHDPIRDYLRAKRVEQPDFALSGDGVHMNRDGHRLLARSVLDAWGVEPSTKLEEPLLELCHEKNQLLHAAWLTRVGHKRPGAKPGLPIPKAESEARILDEAILNELRRLED